MKATTSLPAMKRSSASKLLRLTLAAAAAAVLAGCASTQDEDRLSERPWNAPRSWESGLPSAITEGR